MANKTPYCIAFWLAIISLILCCIGFGTGFWFVSSDPENTFQSVGLWQACFNGYTHPSDLIGKEYHGCWWIFFREYYYIRDWLMPPWFKATQTMMTFSVVFHFLSIPLLILAGRDTNTVRVIFAACVCVWMMAFCEAIAVVVFGTMTGNDRTWVPRYDLDRFSWSYALCVISGFFAIFSGISLTTYMAMRKYELLAKNENKKLAPKI